MIGIIHLGPNGQLTEVAIPESQPRDFDGDGKVAPGAAVGAAGGAVARSLTVQYDSELSRLGVRPGRHLRNSQEPSR